MGQVNDLAAYWKANPPLHLMVAAYLGIKPQPAGTETKLASEEEIMQMVAMFGGGAR